MPAMIVPCEHGIAMTDLSEINENERRAMLAIVSCRKARFVL